MNWTKKTKIFFIITIFIVILFIGFNYLSEISDVNMATDCSMNTTRLKEVIDDTII